jgi:hypothetical protein
MRKYKNRSQQQKESKKKGLGGLESGLTTIVSARTGLTPADDALMKTLPKSYMKGTIGKALDYLLQKRGLQDSEIPLAKSIEKEMAKHDIAVVVNGKNALLNDKISDYLEKKEHQLPNNQTKTYNALEIEISSVQKGGFYH